MPSDSELGNVRGMGKKLCPTKINVSRVTEWRQAMVLRMCAIVGALIDRTLSICGIAALPPAPAPRTD